jgi:DNA-directed RNA polymerase subunit E'/Rpb7
MSKVQNIQKRICVRPEYLNSNVKNYILKKARDNYTNDCSKDIGYITNIIKILNINQNYISNSCADIVFEVELEAETIKPEIGMVFKGNVCMVFCDGILVDVKNIIKVLIPISSLKKYTLSKNSFILSDEFKDSKTKYKVINKDQEIEVCIIGSKYTKKKYACFGNIYEN